MKTLTFILVSLFVGFAVQADSKTMDKQKAKTPSSPASGSEICLSVPKMHCGGCVDRVSESLENVEGVKAVKVDLSSKIARVSVDKTFHDIKGLTQATSDVKYPSTQVACQ